MVGGLPFYWFPDRGIPRGPESRDIGPLSAAAAAVVAAAAAAAARHRTESPRCCPPSSLRMGGPSPQSARARNRKRAANYCPNRVPLPIRVLRGESQLRFRNARPRATFVALVASASMPPPLLPPLPPRFARKRATMFGKIRARCDIDLSREIVILPERVRIIVRLLSVNPLAVSSGREGG